MEDFDWTFIDDDEEEEDDEPYSVYNRAATPVWEGTLDDRPDYTMADQAEKHLVGQEKSRRWGALVEVDPPQAEYTHEYKVTGSQNLRILGLVRALFRDQDGGIVSLADIRDRLGQHKGWQPRYISQRMYMLWKMGKVRRYVAGKMDGVRRGEMDGGQWFGVHYYVWSGWADDEL